MTAALDTEPELLATVPVWTPPRWPGDPRRVRVTPRQADILTHLCTGKTNAQIGRSLFLSENTVKTHVRELFAATGAADRCHLVSMVNSGQLEVRVLDINLLSRADRRVGATLGLLPPYPPAS